MKYCTKCGAKLDDNAVFCTACGTAQAAEAPATPAPAAAESYMAPATPAAQEAPAFSAGYIAPPPQPPKKKKLGLILGIGIPAAVVLVALAAVAAFALLSGNPRQKFDQGIDKYIASFATIPGNEMTTRMQKETFDVAAEVDLSDISSLLGGSDLMMGGLNVEIGAKKLDTEGGIRLSASMAGMDLLKFSAIMTQDKLLAGMVSSMMGEGSVQAASMKLEGKPGDSLEKRLGSLTTGGADAEASARLQKKLLDCYLKHMDSKNYKMQDGTLTDALTGKKLNTKAAVLTLENESFLKFVDACYTDLKDDEQFLKDLKTVLESNGEENVDARQKLDDIVEDIKDYLADEDMDLTAKVHYSGSTPVAVEVALLLTGDEGIDAAILLQKNTQKDAVGYIMTLDAKPSDGSEAIKADADVDIRKTAKGYDVSGTIDVSSAGQEAAVTLDGSTVIEKASSEKYNVESEYSCQWSAPGTPGGSVTVKLEEEVLFGSAVESLQDDKNYIYDELNDNAKEVEKLEDLYTQLFGSLIPSFN